ncbi:MAG: GGDEF domain-containing protein [bacterium]
MSEQSISSSHPSPDTLRFFFSIRLFSLVGVILWLASVVAQSEEVFSFSSEFIAFLTALLLWFVLYSSLFYYLLSRYPLRQRLCGIGAIVLDVIFVALLVRVTGGLNSTFFLAYYLLIAVNTFHSGRQIGGAATFFSAVSYVYIFFESPYSIFIGDFALRLGFMFLVFFVIALLSEGELRYQRKLEGDIEKIDEIHRRLEDSFQELIDEKEAIEKISEAKSELLMLQTEINERRRIHLEFAREINAQNTVEGTLRYFNRYIRGLVSADDVSVVITDRGRDEPLLFTLREEEVLRKEIEPIHPVVSAMLEEPEVQKTQKLWEADDEEQFLPASQSVVDFPVRTVWRDVLVAGKKNIGLLIISSTKPCSVCEYDRERMDEVRILASHLAVAIENIRLRETDALTGIYNRRVFQENLEREMRRTERYGRPLSLIMFDIDHFKRLNDRYGHLAGDAVLTELSRVVTNLIRKIDIFARYGGEEFIIITPETDITGAFDLAERLREAVNAHTFHTETGKPIKTTISLGVSAYCNSCDANKMVQWADKSLYRAKQGGRNRVEIAEECEAASITAGEQS